MTTDIVYRPPKIRNHNCGKPNIKYPSSLQDYPIGTIIHCGVCGAYWKVVKNLTYGLMTTQRRWRRIHPGPFLKRRINRQYSGEEESA